MTHAKRFLLLFALGAWLSACPGDTESIGEGDPCSGGETRVTGGPGGEDGGSICGSGLSCINEVCTADSDEDGVADADDNCPDIPNADQADEDNDGVGDACEDAMNNGNNTNNMNNTNNNTTGPIGPTIETCDVEIAPATDGRCSTAGTSQTSVMIHAKEVLGADVVYENGYVLMDGQDIVCVGCDCPNEASAETTVISCPDSVASPGLINPHDHTTFSLSRPQDHGDERYEHRHDWRRGIRGHSEINTSPGSDSSREGVMYGELRMLFGGATSIAGSTARSDAAGLLRNLDTDDREGLPGPDVDYRTFPLGDSDATLRASGCDYPDIDSEMRATTAGIYLPHVSEGIDAESRNEFLCASGGQAGGADLVHENTSIIHGIGLNAEDIASISADGAKLIWSPRSNIDLYGNTARITTFKSFGVTIALGTDWSASGSANVMRELACAASLNDDYYGGTFSDFEIWRMSTYNAAVAMGVENVVGALADGYVADVTIFDATDRDRYRAIIDGDNDDVVMVMRGGSVLYGDQNIVDALVPAAEIDTCESLAICGRNRRLCLERDAGLTLAGIRGAVDPNAYELFWCDGPPTDEPSCIPFRMGEYTGDVGGSDIDGDGIANADDLCEDIFSPIRPLDGDMQLDTDSDGIGDDCDVCPLNEGDECGFDPDDRDGDMIPNLQDNCPALPNMGQEDGDNDGIGDDCDKCPTFDNTQTSACPATVYDVRAGDVEIGDEIFIDEVVITAFTQSGNGFFVQVPTTASYYNGVDGSGLFVFLGTGSTFAPVLGDNVRITASLSEFGGGLQLGSVTDVVINSSNNALPDVTLVTPAEIGTGGARADSLQGTLVQVANVSVTNANPDAPDEFNEFEVDNALRVDDLLFLIAPAPMLGDNFSLLTGVLNFSFSNSKLLPRDAGDVATGPATLQAFEPTAVSAPANTTGPTTPPLTVALSGPAISDRTVDLTYSAGLSGPAQVTIPMGTRTLAVDITTTGTGNGTVTANLGGDMFVADVVIYDDATLRNVVSLDVRNTTIAADGTLDVTMTLDIPAGPTGENVAITYMNGLISGPGTVQVQPGMLSETFTITAGMTLGAETVTAMLNNSTVNLALDVGVAASPCVVLFSEVIEGSGSNNKAVELYNCSNGDVDLATVKICLVSNDDTTCSQIENAGTGMLATGAVHTICRNDTAGTGDPVDDIANNCDIVTANIANFNGDDRLVLFTDENNDNALDANDTVLDAFGETAVRPASRLWQNATYRRCDFTPYLGDSAFDVATLFTEHAENDASDYGTAPIEGCP